MFTKDREFYKSFISLSLALMLEQAVVLSVNLADNVMLGAYRESALSGVAAVNQIQFVLQQLVYAVSNGMIMLGSQYWGQKRTDAIKRVAAIGMWCGVACTVIMFLLVSLFPEGALHLFTSNEDIVREGMAYLDLMRFSYVIFGMTALMLGTMRIVETVNIALKVSFISLIINISINFLLIKGRFGLPEMGVRGAAIGTVTARAAEFVIVGTYMLKHDKKLGLKLRDFITIDRAMLSDFVRVSTPILIAGALWGVNNAVQTMILGRMDASAIAAQSISATLFLLVKVSVVGAASAASILIGKTIGSGRMDKVREYTRTLQAIYVAMGVVLASIYLLIGFPLLSAYRISDRTRDMARAFLWIQSLTMLTVSYQLPVNSGIIRGGGDGKYMLILDLVFTYGLALPLAALGAFVWKLSPTMVVLLMNCDQQLKCIPAFIRVNRYTWVKQLTRP